MGFKFLLCLLMVYITYPRFKRRKSDHALFKSVFSFFLFFFLRALCFLKIFNSKLKWEICYSKTLISNRIYLTKVEKVEGQAFFLFLNLKFKLWLYYNLTFSKSFHCHGLEKVIFFILGVHCLTYSKKKHMNVLTFLWHLNFLFWRQEITGFR